MNFICRMPKNHGGLIKAKLFRDLTVDSDSNFIDLYLWNYESNKVKEFCPHESPVSFLNNLDCIN